MKLTDLIDKLKMIEADIGDVDVKLVDSYSGAQIDVGMINQIFPNTRILEGSTGQKMMLPNPSEDPIAIQLTSNFPNKHSQNYY